MEVDEDASAICREDQCGEIGDGEGGYRGWPRKSERKMTTFCTPGSNCFEWIKVLSPVVVTGVFGVIAAVFTWRQYKLAQDKLKLDLFERRFAIFHQTWVTVSDIAIKGTQDDKHHELFSPLKYFGPEASFLFGKDIEEYIDEVARNWFELHRIQKPSSQNAAQEAFKEAELTNWFLEQGTKGVKNRFSPYLKFSNWK